ncbi:MAG: ATP-binding protein [Desulfobacula sp.]|jgi:hypothetical protein|uniref:hypothetical protein n=1 Tax=Desulfobacula sp. TaxID=2593537 RepID=UPI001D3C99BE|nr:ATP-binding protein [Desulfobacteraceae bacterium]MBT4639478.1 ATP-binding protein [Deltaproteobacteria bacterium]MBT6499290.1 ATP-binding protein [Deltaproteobacteria bacterium]MBT6751698.1 ATP-binding protein [Desulfobacula sp.]MBT7715937.1 ATP-binding protein [Deltaproteobacteria bacterium]
MKRFIVDSVIDKDNICNLEEETQKINLGVEKGLKMLIYGKRNTGKTSLVNNVIVKQWLQKNSSGFCLDADLMGVKQLSQINERMSLAFAEAYNRCFKMKSVFQNMLEVIKGIKPVMEFDTYGQPKLSFSLHAESNIRSLTEVIRQLELIYQSNIPVLLVLDEFQDIAMIEEAEALFRHALERLNPQIPILILGSKQHLLNRIFAKPNAPLFNWGNHVHFDEIDYQKYWEYMNERFAPEGLTINFENARYLQDTMSRNPEAINRLCVALLNQEWPRGELTREQIETGLIQLVYDRRHEPETYLSYFTVSEQKVLIALAKGEPLKKPFGKDFVQKVRLSAGGVRKIIIKLENNAVVYKEPEGYVLADPLLKCHLLTFRM